MNGIEAGQPLTIDGTPQLRHPAICIYDPWVAGVLKNCNPPLEHQTLRSSTKPSARAPNPPLKRQTLRSSTKPYSKARLELIDFVQGREASGGVAAGWPPEQMLAGEDVVMQSITSISEGGVDLCTITVVDLLAGHVRKLRRHRGGSCIKTLFGTRLVMCNQDSFANHCSMPCLMNHDVAYLSYPK